MLINYRHIANPHIQSTANAKLFNISHRQIVKSAVRKRSENRVILKK